MTKTRHALFAGAILLISCAVLAAPKKTVRKPASLPRYGMVVFSDLCIHNDSGEYGGQRITLQRFAEVDTVLYEYTAGGLSWPVVASDVNIDPRGQQLYFTVRPPDEDERTISGKLADGGKTLVLDGGYCGDEAVPMRLPLVVDYGRKAGTCRACPEPKQKKEEKTDKPLLDNEPNTTASL
ncbi:hypothetical protein [Duganella aceris]|jgi:hypothetical protein|uniref:Uncharacterized protein n=1 Tax=Duganella aceris TaxID=2703883 RepID=A0ABX0FMG9_9BURK|nr:hypothetical protein [Duganella aceris]NGZ85773.1 hypothetical protein [Duganella aceris]